jgi:hypothetical protein
MQGSVWCFGDSSLVNYSDTASITTEVSKVKSRGSCASISDSSGNLLFYVSYDPTVVYSGTDPVKAFNSSHQLLLNGDSMKGGGWYKEIVIVPFPGSDSLYYIFYVGVTLDDGAYYAVVDISANGGSGEVIQKNIQLQNFKCSDGITAIKHGNGRDWWIIFRRWDISTNNFYKYLVTPSGVSNAMVQSIGTPEANGFTRLEFSNAGDRLLLYNYWGLLELYDFDRCSGTLSNPQTIFTMPSQAPWKAFWGAVFSPNDSLLYVTRIPEATTDTSRLYQFDLFSANIATSADTLWETDFSLQMGQLKIAPDGKIYQANNYYGVYPYPDTTYNMYNMNLSVIEYPNNPGVSCGLQPYSFYLGGARTYFGLPNNPNYFLGPELGSGCDTITSVNELSSAIHITKIFPNPVRDILTVNYFLENGKAGELELFSMQGQLLYKKFLPVYSYSQELNVRSYNPGIYTIRIRSGSSSSIKKFTIK